MLQSFNVINKRVFLQPTLQVADLLLGKILNFDNYQGVIIEAEAHIGQNDLACHASKG
ncbi:MAG: DNA-3-methyladenine glycosylase [Candidatus Lariskella arthropodorum]